MAVPRTTENYLTTSQNMIFFFQRLHIAIWYCLGMIDSMLEDKGDAVAYWLVSHVAVMFFQLQQRCRSETPPPICR